MEARKPGSSEKCCCCKRAGGKIPSFLSLMFTELYNKLAEQSCLKSRNLKLNLDVRWRLLWLLRSVESEVLDHYEEAAREREGDAEITSDVSFYPDFNLREYLMTRDQSGSFLNLTEKIC